MMLRGGTVSDGIVGGKGVRLSRRGYGTRSVQGVSLVLILYISKSNTELVKLRTRGRSFVVQAKTKIY